MKKEHVNVLIASPGPSFDRRYNLSLIKTIEALSKLGISYKWLCGSSSLVSEAREITIGYGLMVDPKIKAPLNGEVDYDKIIWIDSDIVWTPEDFLKIYNAKADIVAGIYLSLMNNVVTYSELKFKTNLFNSQLENIVPSDDQKDLLEIDFAGMGFMAVKKGVFESLERPWFSFMSATFNDENNNTFNMPLGEDFTWCHRVKQLGYKIYVDPTVKVGHIKPIVIKGSKCLEN